MHAFFVFDCFIYSGRSSVAPITIHAALSKAAHYFGIRVRFVPVHPLTFRANVKEMKRAINKNTIAVCDYLLCVFCVSMTDACIVVCFGSMLSARLLLFDFGAAKEHYHSSLAA